ncbi:hypothetical protein VTN00DRAFT_4770 [Thermoascus crustaceus]|uniref:uncharacterized protein n=1 Tax=Thermoascus crustaceus TaxID=5088 RepID=UPI003743EA0D
MEPISLAMTAIVSAILGSVYPIPFTAIPLQQIDGNKNPADGLTMALPKGKFDEFRNLIHMARVEDEDCNAKGDEDEYIA